MFFQWPFRRNRCIPSFLAAPARKRQPEMEGEPGPYEPMARPLRFQVFAPSKTPSLAVPSASWLSMVSASLRAHVALLLHPLVPTSMVVCSACHGPSWNCRELWPAAEGGGCLGVAPPAPGS